jgi:hypothetical protein
MVFVDIIAIYCEARSENTAVKNKINWMLKQMLRSVRPNW